MDVHGARLNVGIRILPNLGEKLFFRNDSIHITIKVGNDVHFSSGKLNKAVGAEYLAEAVCAQPDGLVLLKEGDLPHARKLLKAAALTYVSASLMSLLNLGRWLAILRR